ncbi:GNAT family N-acetyltransferase [bacterium]|nr:GNAT family N-acetyltransferase [bacterium]
MTSIRKATENDIPFILQMIRALADYEKEPKEVTISEAQLEKDGFGVSPLYQCLILELEQKPVGFAFYYNRYSTWKGKTLFLEDLFVIPEARGSGLGKLAMLELAKIARDTDCVRFEWQVLDWNQPAIDFYKSLGAELLPQWVNCRLDRKGIEALTSR